MSVLEAQRRICKKAFFSTDRLGEPVTYNGKEIVALVYTGASLSRTDWNDAATSVENANLADLAVFSVCDDTEDGGVPEPQEGDKIVYEGNTYLVAQIIKHDVAGAHYVVTATRNTKAFGR